MTTRAIKKEVLKNDGVVIIETETKHTSGVYAKQPLVIVRGSGAVLWDENGIGLNTNNGTWFLPIDGYATYTFNPHWAASVGGAKRLTNTSQYDWMGYGRIVYKF